MKNFSWLFQILFHFVCLYNTVFRNLKGDLLMNQDSKNNFKNKVVGVIGAGEMGARIAALLATNGIRVLLYDKELKLAQKGIQRVSKDFIGGKPIHSLPNPEDARLITPLCSMHNEDLKKIKEAYWVIEAATEDLKLKQKIFKDFHEHANPKTIFTSNTSGIRVRDITSGLPESFQKRFCNTHFFNPPRIMSLVEVVFGEKTDSNIKPVLEELLIHTLGKNVIYTRDSVNFIANRIGWPALEKAIQLTRDYGLSLTEIDKLAGPISGKSPMGIYRLADFVVHGTIEKVGKNFIAHCPHDPLVRSGLKDIPQCIKHIVDHWEEKITLEQAKEKGWITKEEQTLLEKNPQIKLTIDKKGFYLVIKGTDPETLTEKNQSFRKIFELDLNTFQYVPSPKFTSQDYKAAKKLSKNPEDQLRCIALMNAESTGYHKHSKFVCDLILSNLLYSAQVIEEVTGYDIDSLDKSMKYGYNWIYGPFETWDILGIPKVIDLMREQGLPVPKWVLEMVASGKTRFYKEQTGKRFVYDPKSKEYQPIPVNPKHLNIKSVYKKGGRVIENPSARILDLGDQVACLELKSWTNPEMNPVDDYIIEMLHQTRDTVKKHGFQGLVISSAGSNFSVGANLMMVLGLIQTKQWKMVEQICKQFQMGNMDIRYAPFPVVSAVKGLVLGGGYEIARSSDIIVTVPNVFMGLPEGGVGLLPAGCGCNWMLLNNLQKLEHKNPGPMPIIQGAFMSVGQAQVSYSSYHAKKLGYLRDTDIVIPNELELVHRAKQEVLYLAKMGYKPPKIRHDLPLPGINGRLAVESVIDSFLKQGVITEHDARIGRVMAKVLTGGNTASYTQRVSEYDILALEREGFIELCKHPLSQARMSYMLKNNKPLRN